MMYQIRHSGRDWADHSGPVESVRNLLREYPEAVITMSDGTEWRARDDSALVDEIHSLTGGVLHGSEVRKVIELVRKDARGQWYG